MQPTIRFDVPDMSCNHCVAAITKAVKAADPQAELRFDLGAHRVDIAPQAADADALAAAIRDAGYSPARAAA